MTTTKKLTIAVVALALSLVLVVGGTLAFLVAKTDTVTNTFTYGSITITLTETKGKDLGGGKREFENVIPGAVVEKDPVVTVEKGSEQCFVYVKITNTLVNDSVVTDLDASKWIAVKAEGDVTLYRYVNIVDASEENEILPVFTKVTFPGTLTVTDINALKEDDNKIELQAYAHQSENTDGDTANAAAITWAGMTATN